MRVESIDQKILLDGYMNSHHWCLGGGKEASWEKAQVDRGGKYVSKSRKSKV